MHALGVFLFLFIPLTLYLFLRHPLGILASYSLGIFFMFTHRFAAVPFLERYREWRCLWCGRSVVQGVGVDVEARASVRRFLLCNDRCRSRLRRFAGFVERHRRIVALLIFLPLLYYLPAGYLRVLTGWGLPPALDQSLLQAPIALAVVSVALLCQHGTEPEGNPRIRFPIHNLFLLGVRGTLAVFLVVGLFWLGQVAWRTAAAIGWTSG